MKRKKFFTARFCALIGVLLWTVLLTACNQTETGVQGETTAEDETAEQPQLLTHVFKGENLVIPEGYSINTNVDMVYTEDGRLKMYCRESYQEGEEYITKNYIYEAGLDGSDPVTTEIILEDEMYIDSGVFTDEGILFTVQNYDMETGISAYDLCTYHTADGSITKIENINELFPETDDPGWFYLSGLQVDGDGYIYMASDMTICVLNPDGTKAFDYVSSGYVNELRRDANGVVYIAGRLDNGFGMQAIDKEKKGVGAVLQLPETINASEYYFGPGYEFYYSVDEGLYGYNTGMEEGELVVSWPNSDLNGDNFRSIKVLSPEMILVSYSDRSSDNWQTINCVLKKAPDIDLSKMTVIEIAYLFSSEYGLSDAIIAFNRNSDNVRVVTKDYSVYENGETKLANDILNGLYKPDILCSSGGDSVMSALIERGMFADLYPLIDGDDTIDRDDIVGCVRNSYEVDGKLSSICKTFQIRTRLARKDTVGDKTSWTLSEMLDFAMSLEDGQYLLPGLHKDNAASQLLGKNSYSQFIDMENYTCNFEDETFLKYLNYIASLPSAEEGGYMNPNSDNRYEGQQTGAVMLYDQRYWDMHDIQFDTVPFNTPDVVKIGYPTTDGEAGNSILSAYTYMIPSVSEHPEEAWDFLSSMIKTTGNTRMMTDGFSVLKSMIYEYAKEYETSQTFYRFSGGASGWSGGTMRELDENGRLDGEAGILVTFSYEALDEFVAWLDSTGTPIVNSIPDEITEIINEEITAFTGGARSAEDTAKIIQSRVSLWLAEHS